jgi:hypothetical protein
MKPVFSSVLWIAVLASVLMVGCGTLENVVVVSDNFDKARFRRVGVLVNRMGNVESWRENTPITLQTDYSNRISKPWHSEKEPNQDVLIETDVRLREAIPNYPDYKPLSRFVYERYYGNITPYIMQNVSEIIEEKGYQVIDVRKIASTWPKPWSEMSVAGIINGLANTCDALFILHYRDFGPNKWNDIRSQSSWTGFTDLSYTISMFDTKTRERIIFVDNMRIAPYHAILSDPEILADPNLSKKVKRISNPGYFTGGLTRSSWSINLDFSEEEIIRFVMKYIRRGIVYHHYYDAGATDYLTITIKGLEQIIP